MWGEPTLPPFGRLMDGFLANLFLSLECDWFVGTWESNQDRLLNELASVMLPKPPLDDKGVQARFTWA